MAKHQFKIKQDSKRKTVQIQIKLKYRDRQLLSLSLLAEILILIINLILKCYENDYHNSNYLYFLFVYAEL